MCRRLKIAEKFRNVSDGYDIIGEVLCITAEEKTHSTKVAIFEVSIWHPRKRYTKLNPLQRCSIFCHFTSFNSYYWSCRQWKIYSSPSYPWRRVSHSWSSNLAIFPCLRASDIMGLLGDSKHFVRPTLRWTQVPECSWSMLSYGKLPRISKRRSNSCRWTRCRSQWRSACKSELTTSSIHGCRTLLTGWPSECHGQESCSTYLCKNICIKGFLSKKNAIAGVPPKRTLPWV